MSGSNSPLGTVLLLGALGLLVLMFTRARRQQREAVNTQSSVEAGAEIMTTSGMYATVVSVEDGVIVLETSPGVRSRWDKRAVARIVSPATRTVQSPPEAAENPSEGPAEPSEDDEPSTGRE